MGRHTKDVEDDLPADDGPHRLGRVGKVPLLPAVTAVVAIGAVVSAVSTQQISLNFAGGPPPPGGQVKPQVGGSASPQGRSRHAARDDGSSLFPRDGGRPRVSRGSGRTAVTVAFRTVSTWNAGFHGQVTITNHTTRTVRGWTLILRYPQTRILSAWDVKVIRKGATLVVDNPAEHPYIQPGRSVRVSFTANGASVLPAACSFNGSPC